MHKLLLFVVLSLLFYIKLIRWLMYLRERLICHIASVVIRKVSVCTPRAPSFAVSIAKPLTLQE